MKTSKKSCHRGRIRVTVFLLAIAAAVVGRERPALGQQTAPPNIIRNRSRPSAFERLRFLIVLLILIIPPVLAAADSF
jgi:hypothetical protein